MPRLERVCPNGYSQHIIQRGNNKQDCFYNDSDRKAYLYWLIKYSRKYCVDIHAWVLMDNHVHILCTPLEDFAISKMMQSLGRMYVQQFNHRHKRTGTLWEGRFKSCLVESRRYLLELHRYIELNPVRAGIVDNPIEFSWSSFAHNALGRNSSLCVPHSEYLALGNSTIERQNNYLLLFDDALNKKVINEIRCCTNKGVALGGSKFINQIEQETKQRISAIKPGRK